jgi:hypothetical protein
MGNQASEETLSSLGHGTPAPCGCSLDDDVGQVFEASQTILADKSMKHMDDNVHLLAFGLLTLYSGQ